MKKLKLMFSLFLFYIRFYIIKLFSIFYKEKDLWLISERGTDARDNGYWFFKYLCENTDINCCYVISKKSSDYKKVNKIGKVITVNSFSHFIYFHKAKFLISTHINGYSPNALLYSILEKRKLIKTKGKKVFLQHGITKSFIKDLTSKYIDVDLFISGAKLEYDFLIENFGFTDKVVKLTGLARYDNLINKEKHQILIMPTWRKWLNNNTENEFETSEFYFNYAKVLEDFKLYSFLKKAGYQLVFYPHYEFQKYITLFKKFENDVIKVASFNDYDVQTLLCESELLITDYSSVYFDFAYLSKPIFFFTFDSNYFYLNHYPVDVFCNQFGKSINSVNLLIEEIGNYISKNYDDGLYSENKKKFFGFNDKNNCERIFREILNLEVNNEK